MYDLDALKRFISKHGVKAVIEHLSGKLDRSCRVALTKNEILVNGSPNLELIYSLVTPSRQPL